MNISERTKMVKAMEYIARQINDENVFERWLYCGVADGDIEYGDTGYDHLIDKVLIDYVDDDECFADLMGVFLGCMARAHKSGGLWCDHVLDRHTQNAE